ncbi:MAG TPA: PDZ domain-containing protein [Planctomycetota bacterium]|nr:PDZ domain-containing protein [Planctomycetota bacterium]
MKGDEIVTMNGQPLFSVADFAWVLHRSPATGEVKVSVRRGDAQKELTVALAEGWRLKSDITARVGWWQLRAMASGGMVMNDLADAERDKRKLDHDGLALTVKFIGDNGVHGAAKRAGFQKDDVLVAIDGMTQRMSEGEYIGRTLFKHAKGETVKATVLRGEKKVELTLPMQ